MCCYSNGISLSKQTISYRLQDSELFLKGLFKRAFSLIYSNTLESNSSLLLTYFSAVKLLDATTISVPDQVADDYLGMGGRNAKATLKFKHYIVPLIILSPVLILLQGLPMIL